MSTVAPVMPRKATGQIFESPWADGSTITYRLRVPFKGQRYRVTLGTNREGWSRDRAQVELDAILGRIARGTWEPPAQQRAPEPAATADETFQVTASRWWLAKQPTISPNTVGQYRWALDYLLHEFGREPTASIDSGRVRRFRDRLLAERKALEVNPQKGKKGLSNRSINILLQRLQSIMDEAVEDKVIDANPVSRRHKLAGAKPKRRSFLEADMVRDMLDAASDLEREAQRNRKVSRRAIVATLCLSGLRRAELCDARVGHLDLPHHRIRVPDAKTQAGVREVELPLWLADELREHLAYLRSLRLPVGPRAFLFPTMKGGRRDPNRLNDRIVQKVAARASSNRSECGLSELGQVTPHTLRRTYASLAIAAGRDPKFVMGQLGHTDPEFTLRVYAQMMARQRQDDTLIWELMRFADEPEERPGGRRGGPNVRADRATVRATGPLQLSDGSGSIDA